MGEMKFLQTKWIWVFISTV